MSSTVLSGGRIRVGSGGSIASWLLLEGGKVAAYGGGAPPAADREVGLEGATAVPAFRDAHVHLPATGLYAAGLDLRGEKSAQAVLDRYAERASETEGVLFAGNFEDPLDAPLSGRELDRAVGDRFALLARADMHSCIVSSALLAQLDVRGIEGVDLDEEGSPTGYLREQAASEAWRWFESNLPRSEQIAAIRSAIDLAYSKGVAEVHEMFVVEWRGWDSAEIFLEAIEGSALRIVPYFGTTDVQRVKEMGLSRIGGDWFLDGSFGSHTAWMKEPYPSAVPAGSTPQGISYRSDEEVFGFFREAQSGGLQVGVHAIGDAAIEQCVRGWEHVADIEGAERVRRLEHRIEHLECADDDLIDRAARLGLWGSVQPAFDHYWGGTEGLYAHRIGPERALAMNRFESMLGGGLRLAAGSDSTVTPLDPLLQMSSLMSHHVPEERLDAPRALWLNTGAVAHAGGDRSRGTLEVGQAADIAILNGDPLGVDPSGIMELEVGQTWIDGQQVWSLEGVAG